MKRLIATLIVLCWVVSTAACVPGPSAYIGTWTGDQTVTTTYDDPALEEFGGTRAADGVEVTINKSSSADVLLADPDTDCSLPGFIESGELVFDEKECVLEVDGGEVTWLVEGNAFINSRDELELELDGPFELELDSGESADGRISSEFEGEKL